VVVGMVAESHDLWGRCEAATTLIDSLCWYSRRDVTVTIVVRVK
jgi:hypothetical protein